MPALSTPARDRRLDTLRGLAIILMIVDHVCAVAIAAGAPDWLLWVRRTATRPALPIFMVVSGYLLTRHLPHRRRLVEIAALALITNVALIVTDPGIGYPEILAVWLLLVPAFELIVAYPVEVAILGMLQTIELPIHWSGYQPGYVAAFLALGVIVARLSAHAENTAVDPTLPPAGDAPQKKPGLPNIASPILALGAWLPGWLLPVGRRPLTWYCVHLLALCALFGVLRLAGVV